MIELQTHRQLKRSFASPKDLSWMYIFCFSVMKSIILCTIGCRIDTSWIFFRSKYEDRLTLIKLLTVGESRLKIYRYLGHLFLSVEHPHEVLKPCDQLAWYLLFYFPFHLYCVLALLEHCYCGFLRSLDLAGRDGIHVLTYKWLSLIHRHPVELELNLTWSIDWSSVEHLFNRHLLVLQHHHVLIINLTQLELCFLVKRNERFFKFGLCS